jgi:hypothetical protein
MLRLSWSLCNNIKDPHKPFQLLPLPQLALIFFNTSGIETGSVFMKTNVVGIQVSPKQ